MHIYTNAFSLTSKWLNHFRMRMKILHEFCSLSKFLEIIFRLIGTQVEKEDSCQPVVFVRWIFLMGYVRTCPYLILFNVRAISGEPPLPTRGPGPKYWTASIWQWVSLRLGLNNVSFINFDSSTEFLFTIPTARRRKGRYMVSWGQVGVARPASSLLLLGGGSSTVAWCR